MLIDSSHSLRPFRFALLVAGLLTLLGAHPSSAGFTPCGDSDESGEVTAVDALAALRSAVGLESPCDKNCLCDTDGGREMTTSDALEILRGAVTGQAPSGCGFYDECFNDEDCDDGKVCGTDPNWDCDAACVPE